MEKRAFVIGSQTGDLVGVHSDVEVVVAALQTHGFDVTSVIEKDATREGILERYRGLIEDTKAGDAAVVYYSGHGARQKNALGASQPGVPTWLQYVLPTDIDDRTGGRFNGILAEELSVLQLQLTAKTDNVTTILDCCHSARMSRDPSVVPKADHTLAPFPWADIADRWTEASGTAGAESMGDSNRLAVRFVACAPEESAFEMRKTALGGPHGLLTSRLVPVLTSTAAGSLTWREVLDMVRPGVIDAVSGQRPEVEGPLDRFLFRVETRPTTGVLPIVVDGGEAWLTDAAIFGLTVGDEYAVVAPGGEPANPLGTAEINAIVADRARLTLTGVASADLPAGTAAYPRDVALGARPVIVAPADHPRRDEVIGALADSTRVRVDDGGVDELATIRLGADTVELLDGGGEPLHPPRALDAGALDKLARDVERLARASQVRELASGAGATELPDDVDASFARLVPGGTEVPLAASGEHLFAGDRVVLRFHNRSAAPRFVSVLDVGIAGALSLQTTSQPSGITVAAEETYVLGQTGPGGLAGLELWWPDTVPKTAPRPETYIAIVADNHVANLARLQQEGVATRAGGAAAASRSALDMLVDDLVVGRRDSRPETAPPQTAVRYRVVRFDFTFHAEARTGEASEPAFEVDTRPDPSFQFVAPQPRGTVPTSASVRLEQVTVHSNRAFLKAKVRLDALVLTAPPEGGAVPYVAKTERFDRVRDGDTLPLDRWLVYDGPVGRFLDLAVWLARDDDDGPGLAELLEAETGKEEVQSAIGTLAGLALAAPQAALAVGGVVAVGTLVSSAARLLGAVQGRAIGVFRTSFLPHEQFGSGEGIGRHPAAGLITAGDMSFAFEIVDPQRA